MACGSDLAGLGISAESTDYASRSCIADEAGSGESGSGAGRMLEETCQYPIHEGNQPSQYTGLSVRHWPEQSGWYGPLMNIETVNGKATGTLRQTHELVATASDGSSTGTSCHLADGGTDDIGHLIQVGEVCRLPHAPSTRYYNIGFRDI